MTRDDALDDINTVIEDCNTAAEIIGTEGRLEWDADCYSSMAELLIRVREYIRETT